MKSSIHTDHTIIIDELETSIKFHNLDFVLGFYLKDHIWLVVTLEILFWEENLKR